MCLTVFIFRPSRDHAWRAHTACGALNLPVVNCEHCVHATAGAEGCFTATEKVPSRGPSRETSVPGVGDAHQHARYTTPTVPTVPPCGPCLPLLSAPIRAPIRAPFVHRCCWCLQIQRQWSGSAHVQQHSMGISHRWLLLQPCAVYILHARVGAAGCSVYHAGRFGLSHCCIAV